MSKKVTIMGKKILPVWLVVILLIASGMGAAVGSVLAGRITGEINVSTTGSAGGLLIGGPYCDIIQHTPNEAMEDNDQVAIQKYGDLANEISDTEYTNIAFSNDSYAEQIGAAAGKYAQHGFRFYVGPEENISKIVVTWEGYSTLGKADGLVVTQGDSTTIVAKDDVPAVGSEAEVIITLTGTEVTDAVANGYLYVVAHSDAGDDKYIYTDYVSATVTYTDIDWSQWNGFIGPEIVTRNFTIPDRCIGVHSDSQTGFEAASELAVGDWWIFMLPIKNASNQDITAKLTLEVPECLNVYVVSADEVGDYDARIRNAVRIGMNTWKFIVDADAEKQDDDDYLYIMVNAHDDCGPSIYMIQGILEQVTY